MPDNNTNLQDDSESQKQWITPEEAARLLGVKLRSVYRMIERGALVSNGALHGQLISLETVEAERIRRFAKIAVDAQIDQQETQPRQKQATQAQSDSMALMAVSAAYQERDKALAKLDEVQERWRKDLAELSEARRLDALTIGTLQERVKNLESQLQAQSSAPGSPIQPDIAPKVETSTQPDNAPQNASDKVPPKKRKWWNIGF